MAILDSRRGIAVRRVIRGVIYIPISVIIIIPTILAIGAIYAIGHIFGQFIGWESAPRPFKPLWRIWWRGWHWNQSNILSILGLGVNRFSWIPPGDQGVI